MLLSPLAFLNDSGDIYSWLARLAKIHSNVFCPLFSVLINDKGLFQLKYSSFETRVSLLSETVFEELLNLSILIEPKSFSAPEQLSHRLRLRLG